MDDDEMIHALMRDATSAVSQADRQEKTETAVRVARILAAFTDDKRGCFVCRSGRVARTIKIDPRSHDVSMWIGFECGAVFQLGVKEGNVGVDTACPEPSRKALHAVVWRDEPAFTPPPGWERPDTPMPGDDVAGRDVGW